MGRLTDPDITVLITPEIRTEWMALTTKPSVVRLFARRGVAIEDVQDAIASIADAGEEVSLVGEKPWCRDPNDACYLHAVTCGQADLLVTSDGDLLSLGSIDLIPIVTPATALDRIRR